MDNGAYVTNSGINPIKKILIIIFSSLFLSGCITAASTPDKYGESSDSSTGTADSIQAEEAKNISPYFASFYNISIHMDNDRVISRYSQDTIAVTDEYGKAAALISRIEKKHGMSAIRYAGIIIMGSAADMQAENPIKEFSISGYPACSSILQNGKTLTVVEGIEDIYVIEFEEKLFSLTQTIKMNNYRPDARIRPELSFYSKGSPWVWYSDYADGFILKAAESGRNIHAYIFTDKSGEGPAKLTDKDNIFTASIMMTPFFSNTTCRTQINHYKRGNDEHIISLFPGEPGNECRIYIIVSGLKDGEFDFEKFIDEYLFKVLINSCLSYTAKTGA